ncbi:DUF2829 domain-containing protein [Yersinia pseudotuberculosis]|uniref:DUF2829 domain-containing protein n=1 Tax=Yersinia pseudotuberculosis TaxID=633 RepID=UPI0005E27361|nr:DUF2829 domain-containing protein [Yersinia pseudotuberculosis]CNL87740.1 Protein of uncharacterised function (DUF2829) [Yersinia pseudotuberculosis]
MNFGQALQALKAGHKVARIGWNGKGMFPILISGTKDVEPCEGTPYADLAVSPQGIVTINAHIDMKTATGEMQPGWLASQTDMLAEDWTIVGNETVVNSVGEYELPIGQIVKVDGFPFELREPVRTLSGQHVLDVLRADKNIGIQAV